MSDVQNLTDFTPDEVSYREPLMRKLNAMLRATKSVDGLVASAGLVSVLNVRHPAYGAKGDGVTDDTAALQAATS